MSNKKQQEAKISQGSLRVLSLFSGCGGMDLGMEGNFRVPRPCIHPQFARYFIENEIDDYYVQLRGTPFRTVFANDILPAAARTWQSYFVPRGHLPEMFHTESIVDLVKQARARQWSFPQQIDVVTGGFPCQDFSLAGKRRGFQSHKDHHGQIITLPVASEETRGKLYIWMKSVIELVQPKIFIAENVKGLVNLSNVKDIIQQDFSNSCGQGYLVLPPRVLQAADYGVPQSRERVIFIGIRKSALRTEALQNLQQDTIPETYDPYPKPTHAYSSNAHPHLMPPVSLQKIFAPLSEPEHSRDPDQKYYSKARYMGKHCQGQREVNLQDVSPTIRAEHHGNIEFRRLSIEHGGQMNEELSRGYLERRLTPRECALIQTFPPDYSFIRPEGQRQRFIVSPSMAYKVIGNAVPPFLAFHIAKRLEQVWALYFDMSR
ncbi:MAG: DNA cytosine methyltransferase [Bacteroidales bacterium]|jgi:DNA (cytosine-5)-methyltransferase 1|nr:DNA cytosine methyltransferase [Bacteroidales bacterium]